MQAAAGNERGEAHPTCSAILVFSARTWTRPSPETAASTASKVARTCREVCSKCRSKFPGAAHMVHR
jgi:hypothetical protein